MTAHLVASTLLALVAGPGPSQAEGDLPPNLGAILRSEPLEEFERTHHPVLVFAPSDRADAYRSQMDLIKEGATALRDRDAVVVSLFVSQGGRAGDQVLDMADVAALRRRHDVDAEDFVVILIGKDGVVKSRQSRPVAAKELFSGLDAPAEARPKK